MARVEDEVIAAYQSGESLRTISTRYGRNHEWVREILIAAGVKRRVTDPVSPEVRDAVLAAYADGDTLRTIGNRYGHGEEWARQILIKAGIVRRKRVVPVNVETLRKQWVRYLTGKTEIGTIERELGYSPRTIYRLAHQHGLPLRREWLAKCTALLEGAQTQARQVGMLLGLLKECREQMRVLEGDWCGVCGREGGHDNKCLYARVDRVLKGGKS